MKKLILIVIIIAAVFWWYEKQKTCCDPDKPITVGVLAPLTGPVADFGEEIRIAIESVDVPGVEFILEDTQCDPKVTVSAFNKLVDIDNVQYLVGPGCGGPQEVVASLLKEKDVLTVLPSAATRALYDDSAGKVFQMQYSLEDESAFVAERLKADGYKKVGLVTYLNAFSETHAASFKEVFQGDGLEGAEVTLLDGTTDVVPPIQKLKERGVDAVYATDITFFFAGGLARMVEQGLDVPVFSMYVVELPAARPLVEGVAYAFPGGLENEEEGALRGLTRQSAKLIADLVVECSADFACVKADLDETSDNGTHEIEAREILWKQITNGEASLVE